MPLAQEDPALEVGVPRPRRSCADWGGEARQQGSPAREGFWSYGEGYSLDRHGIVLRNFAPSDPFPDDRRRGIPLLPDTQGLNEMAVAHEDPALEARQQGRPSVGSPPRAAVARGGVEGDTVLVLVASAG